MAGNQHARLRKNVPGEWYTTGECMACGAPEDEARELLSPLSDEDLETYFVRQPETPAEVERACRAAQVCCVSALRYGGRDPAVIQRLGNTPEFCDWLVDDSGRLVPADAAEGEAR
jgi:hypothetical protein